MIKMIYTDPIVIKRCGEVIESDSGLDFDDLALYDTDENGDIIKMNCSPDQVHRLIMKEWYRSINCTVCIHNQGITLKKHGLDASCDMKDEDVTFYTFLPGERSGRFTTIPNCFPMVFSEYAFVFKKVEIPESFEVVNTGDEFFGIQSIKPPENFIITEDHVIGCFKGGSGVQKHFSKPVFKHNPQTLEITKRFFHMIESDEEFPDRFILGNGVYFTEVFDRALWIIENVEEDLVMKFTIQNGIPKDGYSICELEIEGDTLVMTGMSTDQHVLSPRQNKRGYWYQEPFFTVDLEGFWNGIENGKI